MENNKKIIYSFIGLPASGKGTQAAILAERLKTKIVGMGDLIREAMSKGGKDDPFVNEIRKRYDAGIPQPDEVANDLAKSYLLELSSSAIFDNFPFTSGQAEFLDQFIAENSDWQHIVIYINVSPETAVKRVTSRKVCSECGTIFGAIDEMICEKCGGALVVRSDDNVETVKTRIDHYLPKIKEVIDYYRQKGGRIIEIDGEKTVSEVTAEISHKI